MARNRLGDEKSPYLLQHAENPVDWHPWGAEAFAKARAEDKPIFLSIGYSTCHWCHVMERESFENEDIARLLNEHFVPVKVDREERPDVDAQYMTAVQGMTGSGGWPLTAVLLPDGRPFFGGTYFPPDDRRGRPGLRRMLTRLLEAWTDSREQVETSAETVAEFVRGRVPRDPAELDETTLEQGLAYFSRDYDPAFGGFGGAPKFPRPHILGFLLRMWVRRGDPAILAMVEGTLDAMAAGGIRDHLGGGFARYATDGQWLVPHFEKMLYDQALLARAYLEAYQATGAERHADVAREIFTYLERDLRDERGAFHSAEDADSEGEEGRFYVWTPAQLAEALGAEEAVFFAAAYGVTARGNFEGGRTVLSRVLDDASLAARFGLDLQTTRERLAASRQRLFEARATRPRPHRDDKVLTDWNGLALSALALGGRALGETRWIRTATEVADFVDATLWRDGVLLHRYRDGEAAIEGFLDDYAFLGQGLLDLYLATQDPRRLRRALELAEALRVRFEDPDRGGFFFTAAGAGDLMTRDKQIYDGAAPSGNSVAMGLMLRMGGLTGNAELMRSGERALRAFGGAVAAFPAAYPETLAALDLAVGPVAEVVVAGGGKTADAMMALLRRRFWPRVLFLRRGPEEEMGAEAEGLPVFAHDLAPPEQGARAYVCRDRVCDRPVTTVAALAEGLGHMMGGAGGTEPRGSGPPPMDR